MIESPTQLGTNPWILILLIFLELLLIVIPALIAGIIEKKPFKEELNEMGFRRKNDPISQNMKKIVAGIGLGVLFFIIGGFLLFIFKYLLIENLFGEDFVGKGEGGAISSEPIEPSLVQLIIIIILHILIIGICEEAFFRGFIINKCKKKLNLTYVVVISAICFAFYHVPPFLVPLTTIITYFGYFFTFGILLALIYIYFDYSLIPCCIAHSVFNILILISL